VSAHPSAPASAAPGASPRAQVLLDAVDHRRRLLQHGLALLGVVLLLAAGAAFLLTRGLSATASIAAVLAIVAMACGFRVTIGWTVPYKGHEIRFENHPIRGEALLIDGVTSGRGRIGIRNTLQAVVASGDGAGDLITAESVAGLLAFRCRILAEPARR